MIVQDWNIHQVGIFVCKNCQNELFSTNRQDKYKTVFMQPFSEHSIEKTEITTNPNHYAFEMGKVVCQNCQVLLGKFEFGEWGIAGMVTLYTIDPNLLWLKIEG